MAGWIPPVAAGVARCGNNPEQCIRTATNAVKNVVSTAQKIDQFNREMQQSAAQGNQAAYSYLNPESWQYGGVTPPINTPQIPIPPGYEAIPPKAIQSNDGTWHVIVALPKSPYT